MAGSKPGERRGGRQKGTPNKTTAATKAMLEAVHKDIGGRKKMAAWAKDNPGEFYKLWIKLLPTELSGPDGEPLVVQTIERRIVSGKHGS